MQRMKWRKRKTMWRGIYLEYDVPAPPPTLSETWNISELNFLCFLFSWKSKRRKSLKGGRGLQTLFRQRERERGREERKIGQSKLVDNTPRQSWRNHAKTGDFSCDHTGSEVVFILRFHSSGSSLGCTILCCKTKKTQFSPLDLFQIEIMRFHLLQFCGEHLIY